MDVVLPDSVTTWAVSAIALAASGLCVAPPLPLPVFSRFFLNLHLPYR